MMVITTTTTTTAISLIATTARNALTIGWPARFAHTCRPARHMEGFGVHTFKLVNKAGRETLVKFHWKPKAGVKCLLEEEAVAVGGANHSHATQVGAAAATKTCT